MTQSFYIVNLDLREYINPWRVDQSSQLMTLVGSGHGALGGLALLLAASNGKGTGDYYPAVAFVEGEPRTDVGLRLAPDAGEVATVSHREHPVARHIVGRWAGERIALVGDYYDADAADEAIGLPPRVCEEMREQTDGWVDITEHVVATLDLDPDTRSVRHEVQIAPSGARYTHADGSELDRRLPRAPRSILNEETGEITAVPSLPGIDPCSEPVESEPLPKEAVGELEELLDAARNVSGALDDEMRERVVLAAEHPTQRTWSAAYSVIVQEGMFTLWQLVGHVDPSFPQSAPHNELNEPQWERVPSGRVIFEATALAVRIGEDEQLGRLVRDASQQRLAEFMGHERQSADAPLGERSRRNYRLMTDDNLRWCCISLRAGVGDAVEKCEQLGGDPRADLAVVEEIAAERGLTL